MIQKRAATKYHSADYGQILVVVIPERGNH